MKTEILGLTEVANAAFKSEIFTKTLQNELQRHFEEKHSNIEKIIECLSDNKVSLKKFKSYLQLVNDSKRAVGMMPTFEKIGKVVELTTLCEAGLKARIFNIKFKRGIENILQNEITKINNVLNILPSSETVTINTLSKRQMSLATSLDDVKKLPVN